MLARGTALGLAHGRLGVAQLVAGLVALRTDLRFEPLEVRARDSGRRRFRRRLRPARRCVGHGLPQLQLRERREDLLPLPPARVAPCQLDPLGLGPARRRDPWAAVQLDRATASGAAPAESGIPEDPVVVERIEGQKRSQDVREWLAEPETAASTAGRDMVPAGRRFPVHGTAGHQRLHLRANGRAPLVSEVL